MSRKLLPRSPLRLTLCALCFCLVASCVTAPRRATHTADDQASQPRRQGSNAVSINHASKKELERLPGIGPALASRIVEHRERYGPFRRVEHLLMVRGIGERRFMSLRPHITAEPTAR